MKVNLILLKIGGINKGFRLPSMVTIIGRRQDCDMCVPLMVISRRHCAINMDEGKLWIRDLDSRNGTFVNGEKIDEVELKAGDNIQIGPLSFLVQIDGVPAEISSENPLLSDAGAGSKVQTDNADIIPSGGEVEPEHDLHSTEIIGIPSEYDD